LFKDKPYVSLEDPQERAFAEEDPKGFLKRFEKGAIFDEAQRWPDLFSHLQGMVDQDSCARSLHCHGISAVQFACWYYLNPWLDVLA